MKALFNSQLISEEEFSPGLEDRAFRYGDGLFETLIFANGSLLFFDLHFKRLTRGMQVLSLELVVNIGESELKYQIKDLISINNLTSARIKIQVWRQAGGLYTPSSRKANILVTVSCYNPPPKQIIEKAGFAENTRVVFSQTSFFKTLSSLKYVVAGLEKTARGIDELIILNQDGYVAECSSSNIFWKRGNTWFTPPVTSGCIAGIRREYIISELKKRGIVIREVLIKKEGILKSDAVCTCNVTGVFPIMDVEGRVFSISESEELQIF